MAGIPLFSEGMRESSAKNESNLSKTFKKLSRSSKWEQIAVLPLNFPSGHPQGMVRVGEFLYISTVEIIKPTTRYPELRDGYDRDTGEGIGYLYKVDAHGNLVAKVALGEGAMYHPGGIDYDGEYIWVPAAEYRPNSASIIYRVDPVSLKPEKMFEYKDHIGGIIHDTDNSALHAVSWGSRRFYRWPIDSAGKIRGTDTPRNQLMILNPEFYIDYQDCHYIGNAEMLCSGLSSYKYNDVTFRLGAIEIVNLRTNSPVHQVPVELWSPKSGRPMTQNPFWMEEKAGIITAYFIPDDDDSTLYVYKVTP